MLDLTALNHRAVNEAASQSAFRCGWYTTSMLCKPLTKESDHRESTNRADARLSCIQQDMSGAQVLIRPHALT